MIYKWTHKLKDEFARQLHAHAQKHPYVRRVSVDGWRRILEYEVGGEKSTNAARNTEYRGPLQIGTSAWVKVSEGSKYASKMTLAQYHKMCDAGAGPSNPNVLLKGYWGYINQLLGPVKKYLDMNISQWAYDTIIYCCHQQGGKGAARFIETGYISGKQSHVSVSDMRKMRAEVVGKTKFKK